ncbi:hypothetical protein EVAR_67980_1 [Eumeta japonica]|uniref:Uncharacterized protein n=1 Tax=Eumeta variegata TaxID=151549 RepID=A0A4C1SBG5_EUMVA|nr:hypothetical protein EVAR_67980_1 [Eumeta japonica]
MPAELQTLPIRKKAEERLPGQLIRIYKWSCSDLINARDRRRLPNAANRTAVTTHRYRIAARQSAAPGPQSRRQNVENISLPALRGSNRVLIEFRS